MPRRPHCTGRRWTCSFALCPVSTCRVPMAICIRNMTASIIRSWETTGNKFAQAPEHTVHLSATYTHRTSVGEIVANASYAYISSVTFADDNLTTPGNTAPGYGLVDLRLDWRNISDSGIDLGIYAKNLTEDRKSKRLNSSH